MLHSLPPIQLVAALSIVLLVTTFQLQAEVNNTIRVSSELPAGVQRIKWVIESDRNEIIETYSSPSPHAPNSFTYRPKPDNAEIWFPTVDIEWDPNYEVVARFSQYEKGDTVSWNGNFNEFSHPIAPELRFTHHVEHWENQIFVQSDSAQLDSFSIETLPITVSANQSEAYLAFQPLSAKWSGSVRFWIQSNPQSDWELLNTFPIASRASTQTTLHNASSSATIDSLKSSVRYLLESQNRNPLSPTYGGFYLFYDKDSQSYRRSDWMWSYGPAIQLLTRAAEIKAIAQEFGYSRLMEAARLAAECSLRFQINDANHPANGLVICRFDPRYDSPRGAEGFCSPADSLFLAGFGWIPYYQATGDERFLDASKKLAESVDRILDLDALIEQDYLLREGQWKNWTMDESGFGMIGFAAAYQSTSDSFYQDIGQRYMDGLLDALEREDGLWDRVWHRNQADHSDNGWPVNLPRGEPKLFETKFSTRGLGWAMIGLNSACNLFPENKRYLDKAIALSNHLLGHQAEDGHWDFLFKEPQFEDEKSAKGTALWTLQFYQLYRSSKDPRHLAAARKGLNWCIQNRYLENKEGHGGIFETNRESGVIYRRWNELSCSYTLGFFGLALLEELSLEQSEAAKTRP